MTNQSAGLIYPFARTEPVVDVYHGIAVPDPYRWLEDADSTETRAWIGAENQLTSQYLGRVPDRARIESRLSSTWNYERFGIPFCEAGRCFYTHNSGLQNQAVLYVVDAAETPRILLDPNGLSSDGTVALSGVSVSRDGELLAYSLSDAGSDWMTWRVRNVAAGVDLPDTLRWCKFSGAAWNQDSSGFFYCRFDEPLDGNALQGLNVDQKVMFHRLGTKQGMDELVYARPDHPDWNFRPGTTDDGRYLVITAVRGTERRHRVFVRDLAGPAISFVELAADGDAYYRVIGNVGSEFIVLTDRDAPNRRIVAISLSNPSPESWREIVAEKADAVEDASLFGDDLICVYLRDARSAVIVADLRGLRPQEELSLPGIGTVDGFYGRQLDVVTYYSFSSFTHAPVIFRFDIAERTSKVFNQVKHPFDSSSFETRQIFSTSRDGTRVPMFVTTRRDAVLDGSMPVLLYGYGGFDVSLTPFFSPAVAVWLEMGGVYVVANIRGGGEYGTRWHEGGMKTRRQNVFDDFISCAEELIARGYTSRDRLAINGGSNGGLLVSACMIQRPDLFAAVIPQVGVLDMIRFPKFTIGWAWTSDYGSPDDAAEFALLYAYSPYHNLRPGARYPATLITTSDHDDRVVPAHSFKFAAALQAAQAADGPPTLIRIETRAGHGAGKPVAKIVEECADRYAFLVQSLAMTLPASFAVLEPATPL